MSTEDQKDARLADLEAEVAKLRALLDPTNTASVNLLGDAIGAEYGFGPVGAAEKQIWRRDAKGILTSFAESAGLIPAEADDALEAS